MRCFAWLLALVALPAFALCGEAPKTGQRDPGAEGAFLIDPVRSVGHITPTCSEKDLIRDHGARNVRRARIDLGEGEAAEGTVLFSGTPNAVEILWKRSFSHPTCLIISSPGPSWRTREGITIGTTVETIERINRYPFKLTGFGWDYEGRTVSWGKGKLPQQLQLVLKPTQKVSEADERAVAGDHIFSSAHPAMIKKKLVVSALFIRWD